MNVTADVLSECDVGELHRLGCDLSASSVWTDAFVKFRVCSWASVSAVVGETTPVEAADVFRSASCCSARETSDDVKSFVLVKRG